MNTQKQRTTIQLTTTKKQSKPTSKAEEREIKDQVPMTAAPFQELTDTNCSNNQFKRPL